MHLIYYGYPSNHNKMAVCYGMLPMKDDTWGYYSNVFSGNKYIKVSWWVLKQFKSVAKASLTELRMILNKSSMDRKTYKL